MKQLLILAFWLAAMLCIPVKQSPKNKWYFKNDSITAPVGCCIVLPQSKFFDSINKSGSRMYIDSCKSNDSARVYIFTKKDTIIKL